MERVRQTVNGAVALGLLVLGPLPALFAQEEDGGPRPLKASDSAAGASAADLDQLLDLNATLGTGSARSAANSRVHQRFFEAPLSLSQSDGFDGVFLTDSLPPAGTTRTLELRADLSTAFAHQDETFTLKNGDWWRLRGITGEQRLRLFLGPMDFWNFHLELRALSRDESLEQITAPTPAAGGVVRQQDAALAPADLRIGTKWHFWAWDHYGSGLAGSLTWKASLGDPDSLLSSGRPDTMAGLHMTRVFGDLTWHGSISRTWVYDARWFHREYRADDIWSYGAAVVIRLIPARNSLYLIVQAQGHQRPIIRGLKEHAAPWSLRAGLRLAWGAHSLEAGAMRRLNDAAAPYGAFLQVGVLAF